MHGDIESSFGARRFDGGLLFARQRCIARSVASPVRDFGGRLADFVAKPEPARGPAAELWRKTLSRIPTHFGRLIYLSSLRDAPTGRYAHDELSQMMGADVADRTLRHSHHQIFTEWLGLTLAQQKADLDEYLMAAHIPPTRVPYRNIVPATAHQVERQLYFADLETLLELIRIEHGGDNSGRDDSGS